MIMKHLVLNIIVLLITLLICNPIFAVETFTVDNMVFSLRTTTEVAIEHLEVPKDGKVVFPSEITYNNRTFKVTIIGGAYDGDPWGTLFKNPEQLISIVIPPSIHHIGSFNSNSGSWSTASQFHECVNLKKVIIEDSDKDLYFPSNETKSDVRESIFVNCPLEEVYIGRNITYSYWSRPSYHEIRKAKTYGSPFKKLKTLEKVTFSTNVTKIEPGLFFECESLKEIDIPSNVKEIPNSTFYNCYALSSIILPESLLSIGDCAFCCTNIHSIIFPKTIEKIGDSVCSGCDELEFVSINDIIKYIEPHAFSGCGKLTKVIIGKSVERIYSNAFYGDLSIQEIESRIEDPKKCQIEGGQNPSFSTSTYAFATLYVPIGTKEKYMNAPNWSSFYYIVEGSPSTLEKVKADPIVNSKFIDLMGRQSSQPHKGVNIEVKSDGTTKKVFIK